MILEDKHKCFICGNEINWMSHIKEGPTGPYPYGQEPIGDAVAIGSDGDHVNYEITVKCLKCQNKNKFTITVDR